MRLNIIKLLLILLSLIISSNNLYAALRSSKDNKEITPEAICNPIKSAGDVILPMPNGLFMTFRAVAIPAKNALYDRKFTLGLTQAEGERGMYERRVESYVTAPFTSQDLPKSWQKELSSKKDFFYYFIGKYEISNGQWQAIMGGDIPNDETPDMPKANISWYDIQDFLKKYNMWLLEKHPSSLPSIDDSPAYLRLPTEEEWEFAARGGNLPPEKLDFDDFPLEDGRNIEDYAIFGEKYTIAKPIGTKLPNPLGLHDIAGNLAELTNTPFRFTIADSSGSTTIRRLHGSQGGFLSKGGSFLSSTPSDVYPGKRIETKMFIKKKENEKEIFVPFSSRNIGARLVLTCLNVPSSKRASELYKDLLSMSGKENEQMPKETKPVQDENQNITGKDKQVNLDPKAPLIQEIDKVIKAAASPFMKSNLYQLRDMVEDNNTALEKERDANLANAIRTTIYKAEALNDMAFRCRDVYDTIQKAKNQGNIDNEKLKEMTIQATNYFNLFETYIRFYILALKDLQKQANKTTIVSKINQVREEYSGSDTLSKHMKKNLNVLEKHLNEIKNGSTETLKTNQILEDILAPSLYKKTVEILKLKK